MLIYVTMEHLRFKVYRILGSPINFFLMILESIHPTHN